MHADEIAAGNWTGSNDQAGRWLARTRNIDIRNHGSGNIGATNVARTLGSKAGLLVLFADCSKGVVSVALADRLMASETDVAIAGLLTFLGHLFSVFLKFKGGKGVATGLGIHLYMMPLATLGSVAVFAATLWISRYVSLSSILAAFFLPVFGIFLKMPLPYISASLAIALMVLHRHHENIQRMLAGIESPFLKK
ncbi:MAG: glycerol-3-phosphate 1-O-acyltransferase PlsY [Nitrospinae bacterium]|nr:glycerol-3-phosphate 1-O-acyltransferase PlsY [Nitrospinota bacterium]